MFKPELTKSTKPVQVRGRRIRWFASIQHSVSCSFRRTLRGGEGVRTHEKRADVCKNRQLYQHYVRLILGVINLMPADDKSLII